MRDYFLRLCLCTAGSSLFCHLYFNSTVVFHSFAPRREKENTVTKTLGHKTIHKQITLKQSKGESHRDLVKLILACLTLLYMRNI